MAERAEKKKIAVVAMLVAGGVAASCGTSGDGSGGLGSGGDSNTQDGGGGGGGGNDGDPGGGFGSRDSGGSTDSGFVACATDSQRGKPIPLTMAMMLDSSGSMWLRTATGEFKWDTLKKALGTFFTDPQSSGLSIGLQYFPLFANSVPNACTTSDQCGAAGPCVNKACNDAGGNYCTTDADCAPSVKCVVPLGQCHEEGEFKCRTDADCKTAYGEFGTCDPIIATYCFRGEDSCNIPDYAKPEVNFADLPGAAPTIAASLNSHFPNGYTPTSAALKGLENMATDRQSENPDVKVVSVLVTDGLPTKCDQNINNVAAIAATALTAGVKTYVIGVFAQSEEPTAKPNLDLIAKAGGSDAAFIVNTDQNASQELLKALAAIRGNALPCEFGLPLPSSGVPDYGKVNVQFTAGDGSAKLFLNVPNEAACDATVGGWHYDVDPASGTPTKVQLCPVSCNAVKADAAGAIDILQGCKDVVVK